MQAAPALARMTRTKAEATDGGACSKSSFYDDFTGQVQATVEYETSELSPDAASRYLDVLARIWEKTWGQVDRTVGHVGVHTGKDGFVLYGNSWPGTHSVSVSGNSGCIWVNGTPGPRDNP